MDLCYEDVQNMVGNDLEGMVMGAAVTNVVMSGKLTVPMMKRYGFRKEFAAAVEVVASTAGQIILPVMGLAAFRSTCGRPQWRARSRCSGSW